MFDILLSNNSNLDLMWNKFKNNNNYLLIFIVIIDFSIQSKIYGDLNNFYHQKLKIAIFKKYVYLCLDNWYRRVSIS